MRRFPQTRCACDFEYPDQDPVVEVHTGDGADSVYADTGLNIDGYGSSIDGGAGPDTLSAARRSYVFGGLGDDHLVGLRGKQHLVGAAGADSLEGGADDDLLEGGVGADVIAGGPGSDSVSYVNRTAPVWISLDDRANDGAADERDWVRADVENASGSRGPTNFVGNAGPNGFYGYYGGHGRDVVRAGAGDDRIYGASGRDLLSGGAGDDLIDGYNGADVIQGGPGNDLLLGQRGDDDLRGGSGNDRLSGGREEDTLRAGPGRDLLWGNGGADILYARDQTRERVRGGLGHDRARVDPIDSLFSVEGLF